MTNPKTYMLGDRLTFRELEVLGIERDGMGHLWGESRRDGKYARAVRTDEFRAPKAGEWYLSGSTVLAYRAPNDLSTEFRIAAIVVVDKRTTTTERVGLPVRFGG